MTGRLALPTRSLTTAVIANPAAPGTLPGPADDVAIAGTTDFTVDYFGPPGVQRSVGSLTLGGTSTGTQTLLIKTANGTGDGRLEVSGPATITAHGRAILDQDATGLPSPGNTPQLNFNGPATNAGVILARREGPSAIAHRDRASVGDRARPGARDGLRAGVHEPLAAGVDGDRAAAERPVRGQGLVVYGTLARRASGR